MRLDAGLVCEQTDFSLLVGVWPIPVVGWLVGWCMMMMLMEFVANKLVGCRCLLVVWLFGWLVGGLLVVVGCNERVSGVSGGLYRNYDTGRVCQFLHVNY